jgi:hypothetical protein
MRRVARPVLIFSVAALVGPLLRLVTWPPSQFMDAPGVFDFLYQLILLLWPAQPIAVIEVNTGPVIAAATAVGANVLLFAVVGVIVGALGSRRVALLVIFIGVSFAVVWASGSPAEINLASLTVAIVLYAVLSG